MLVNQDTLEIGVTCLVSRVLVIEGVAAFTLNTLVGALSHVGKLFCGGTIREVWTSCRTFTSQSSQTQRNPPGDVMSDGGNRVNDEGTTIINSHRSTVQSVGQRTESFQVSDTPRATPSTFNIPIPSTSSNVGGGSTPAESNHNTCSSRAIQNLLADGSSKLYLTNDDDYLHDRGNGHYLTLADAGLAIESLRCSIMGSPQQSISLNSYNSTPQLINFMSPSSIGSCGASRCFDGHQPETSHQSANCSDLNGAVVNGLERETIAGVFVESSG